MYTFEHPATEQTPVLTDYRYIGANPNNYVSFNNELWRIIGVFTVEDGTGNTEQRIKIVRNEKLSGKMQWNSNKVNEWSTATLNTYLNGEYYNGLDATSKSMVADTKYYLGGYNHHDISGDEHYNNERGITVYGGNDTNWVGKIALLYPSDYIYTYALGVDNDCYTNGNDCGRGEYGKPTKGWIYKTNSNVDHWTLNHKSDRAEELFVIATNGRVRFLVDHYVYNSWYVRPTLYLSSSVKIDSGDGSEQSPYSLKL